MGPLHDQMAGPAWERWFVAIGLPLTIVLIVIGFCFLTQVPQ